MIAGSAPDGPRVLAQCGDVRGLLHALHGLLLRQLTARVSGVNLWSPFRSLYSQNWPIAGVLDNPLWQHSGRGDAAQRRLDPAARLPRQGDVNILTNQGSVFTFLTNQEFPPPELFSHCLVSGHKLYGMIYKPHNAVPGVRWDIRQVWTLKWCRQSPRSKTFSGWMDA